MFLRRTSANFSRLSRGGPRLWGLEAFAQLPSWAYQPTMEYKGIRYVLRLGIAREEWSVGIHPPGTSAIEKSMKGTRQMAERMALSMIETWLKLHGEQGPKNSN